MKLLSFSIFILIAFNGRAQSYSAFEAHYFDTKALNLPYRYLRPPTGDKGQTYPLVIFLHGAGHKGRDNQVQLQVGGSLFLVDSNRKKFPGYVLFPQCPVVDAWTYFESYTDSRTGKEKMTFPLRNSATEVMTTLVALIDSLLQVDAIDNKRIYVMGLSQGGMGVLEMAYRYPQLIAAGVSMCGAGNFKMVKAYSPVLSLWLFHGSRDEVIDVSYSRGFYRKLQNKIADVRYREYEGLHHDCWTKALQEPDLLSWLFSKVNN